jgi:predicted restriction endonuclease
VPSGPGQRTYRHTYAWRNGVKAAVLAKTGGVCIFCGWPGTDGKGKGMMKAHIVDHDQGGSDDPSNLLPMCPTHHAQYDAGKRQQAVAGSKHG